MKNPSKTKSKVGSHGSAESQTGKILHARFRKFHHFDFILEDPISIPHRFSKKADIEIAGFLASLMSWGRRDIILKKSNELLGLMDDAPAEFINGYSQSDFKNIKRFVHRTFNGQDFDFFFMALKNIYLEKKGLEGLITSGVRKGGIKDGIQGLRLRFLELNPPERTLKHIPNPGRSSPCKRMNMFLRWMVRKDDQNIDFGIWKGIQASALLIPLDIHVGKEARKLGLLKRKQNDWQAVEELTGALKKYDRQDPVRFDFALFGEGVSRK